MPRYSSSETIYPEHAPYQPSRSALRRRFGNRAIIANEQQSDYTQRPGGTQSRLPSGKTDEATWRKFFTPTTSAAALPGPRAATTYFDEATPFGRSERGVARSGTNFVSQFGTGSVRTAAHMAAGINPPEQFQTSAWDAFLKSPAPAAPPPASMNLLPSPRQGTTPVPRRTSDFSPTPTADDYIGAVLSRPSKFSITTGVLDRLAGPSPWEEPI